MLPMPLLSKREPEKRLAFFGPMCSGKSWCADYLAHSKYVRKVAFADRLKELALELYGVKGKSGNDRTILQELGQDLRKHDSDVWIKIALEKIRKIEEDVEFFFYTGDRPIIVLDDLRYTNEANVLRENGFTLIQVYCPEEIRQERIARLHPGTPVSSYYHASEQEWQHIAPDYVVESVDHSTAEWLNRFLVKEYA